MKNEEQVTVPGISPADKALRILDETSYQSPNKEALKEAIQDAKKVRQTAIDNAKEALDNAFGTNILQVTGDKSNTKGFEETKKILTNFHSRMERYAKYISKEGSAILCIKIANSKETPTLIFLNELPSEDQEIIKELVKSSKCTIENSIYVEMDEFKDFKFKTINNSAVDPYYLFNTTLHPKPSNVVAEVPVNHNGENIQIGGRINLNKKDVQKLCGIEGDKMESDFDQYPKRIPVANRNAYEIRNDILEMSLMFHKNKVNSTEDDIIKTAQKFYSFVEQKPRR
jgi:hypothetical protein